LLCNMSCIILRSLVFASFAIGHVFTPFIK
jgi:hypothetical protein